MFKYLCIVSVNLFIVNTFPLFEDILLRSKRDVKLEDVKFFLFTRTFEEKLLNNVTEKVLDVTKPTRVIIHGYTQNHKKSWLKEMTDAFLKDADCNVIQVDWEKPARSLYINSAKNTRLVGNIIGDFILDQGIDLETLHIVGHSLGAHLAGFTGKRIKATDKIANQITGLDPAGPYFSDPAITESDRLNKDDAVIVVAIHTDYNLYGYKDQLASLDIYVNGGFQQPSCKKGGADEHKYSGLIESKFVSHRKFNCKFCETVKELDKEECENNENIEMEINDIKSDTKGICFAKTNVAFPYLSA